MRDSQQRCLGKSAADISYVMHMFLVCFGKEPDFTHVCLLHCGHGYKKHSVQWQGKSQDESGDQKLSFLAFCLHCLLCCTMSKMCEEQGNYFWFSSLHCQPVKFKHQDGTAQGETTSQYGCSCSSLVISFYCTWQNTHRALMLQPFLIVFLISLFSGYNITAIERELALAVWGKVTTH